MAAAPKAMRASSKKTVAQIAGAGGKVCGAAGACRQRARNDRVANPAFGTMSRDPAGFGGGFGPQAVVHRRGDTAFAEHGMGQQQQRHAVRPAGDSNEQGLAGPEERSETGAETDELGWVHVPSQRLR